MWLINAQTLRLEEVWDERKARYAILSHRWEDEEVSFRDMQNLAVATKLEGFAKIRKSCEQALEDNNQYLWIDTCCINKESSAELSEAINSMYRWYQASAVCYAYLFDVHSDGSSEDVLEQQFKDSVWFSRGWTLQELLAPSNVRFYGQNWNVLGTKQTLGRILTKVTGIDEGILGGKEPLGDRSIAQRMSWASKRKTTRKEDRAYCLLGIFDVNMPLLYGEGGKKAFLRLQEEIIKHSDDHTIFAWSIHRYPQPGLLADKPKAFKQCQLMRAVGMRAARTPYSMTNRGLSIKPLATPYTTDTYLVRLDCVDESLPKEGIPLEEIRLGIFLRRLHEDDQFARVDHEGKTFLQLPAFAWTPGMSSKVFQGTSSHVVSSESQPVTRLDINVRQHLSTFNSPIVVARINGFRIATLGIFEDAFKVSAFNWDSRNNIMTMKPGDFGTAGTIDISALKLKIKFIKLGFDFSFNPVCFVADRKGSHGYPVTKPRDQWSAGEYMNSLSIHQRSPFDTGPWSTVRSRFAMELEHHPGLWALKGDRFDGLDVRFVELGSLQIKRVMFEGKDVWDVYLELEKPEEGRLQKFLSNK